MQGLLELDFNPSRSKMKRRHRIWIAAGHCAIFAMASVGCIIVFFWEAKFLNEPSSGVSSLALVLQPPILSAQLLSASIGFPVVLLRLQKALNGLRVTSIARQGYLLRVRVVGFVCFITMLVRGAFGAALAAEPQLFSKKFFFFYAMLLDAFPALVIIGSLGRMIRSTRLGQGDGGVADEEFSAVNV